MDLITVHLSILGVTAIAILYADHLGYQYMKGTRLYMNHSLTVLLHRIVWAGLLGMVASGFLLARSEWDILQDNPVFYLKMGFVLVLVINAFAIGKLSQVTSTQSFKDLPPHTQKTLVLSGALSSIGWAGAAIIGYFFL